MLATLAGFVLTSLSGLNPAWAAAAGAVVLAAGSLIRGQDRPAGLVRAVSIPFLLFVLGLGIVVEAVVRNGLGAVLARVIPAGSSLPSLLALAGLAALLANVVNNLQAVLVMLSVLAGRGLLGGPGPVLAVLIGVDIGPNLSYQARWPRCCGGACWPTATTIPTWVSSPISGCSPCLRGCSWSPWRCGRCCGSDRPGELLLIQRGRPGPGVDLPPARGGETHPPKERAGAGVADRPPTASPGARRPPRRSP